MEKNRLNKFLALQLGVSRRQADELISGGKISINGKKKKMMSIKFESPYLLKFFPLNM